MRQNRIRTQSIKYNNNGDAYVTHYNARIYLRDFIKTVDSNNNVCGIYSVCNTIYYLIYIDDRGENARIKDVVI